GDVCTGGVCAGVDHCVGVVCAAQDQCHVAGTCIDHATGACSNPAKADGTTCDDGNPNTTGDVCTGGVCAGVDHCVGVVCAAQDQCHVAGTCIDHATGACSNPAQQDGTACSGPNLCTAYACATGACVGTPVGAGALCGSGLACDNAGVCHGPPNVVSVTPADGGSALADTTVVVTFDQPMDATTLTLQQGVGACTGAIQVSLDNFSTCMGFNAATPAMSSGGTVATITPAPGLLINRTYSVRVTTAATGINQLAMVAAYSQTSGFVTSSPIVGDGQAWNEAGLPYEVNACSTAAPASISATAGTTTTIDGAVWQPGFLEADYQGLTAQVGFGPMTVNPEYQTGWTWVDAPYLASSAIGGGTDLQATYEGTITLPAAGTYWYAFRISLDGKTWTYCDSTRDDGGSGALSGLTFDFEDLSQMTSTP
ncbi:MAG TPA: Ig-like domain-containing protein, partial [Anaeromyxobacter sp.]|nr:Ig-like domain-containing protein [Anaeromyxobacter sp.]